MTRIIRLLLLLVGLLAPATAWAQFPEQRVWGGTSGGSANVQTITIANYSSLTTGVPIRWIAGFSNTGATTLQVSSTAATAMRKVTNNGLAALTGGEIIAGGTYTTVYDGTYHVLQTSAWVAAPTNQVQLVRASSTSVQLNRFAGAWFFINGSSYQVQSPGPTLAVGALANSTLYYVYAYMSGTTMTLEAVATAPIPDTVYGNMIKTGDASRALVGMVYLLGGNFIDTPTQRFVRSWYNDPGISLLNNFTTGRSTASATFVEVNSEIRIELLVWTGETVQLNTTGYVIDNASANIGTSLGIDGATAENAVNLSFTSAATVTVPIGITLYRAGLSQGYHYVTLLGKTDTGTATWAGSGTSGTRTTLQGFAKLGSNGN